MRLSSLFSPQSIALIGASTQEGSVGWSLAHNITRGFSGQSYLINPKATELLGRPCFPSVLAISDAIDLAIIAVPAALVPTVLEECGKKEVAAAVIISAGFKETGEQGKALEDEVVRIAHAYNITILGPNCLGFLAPPNSLNASFASALPQDGSIAFFSQSGALLTALLDMGRETLGYRLCVSTGNKALVKENDLLRFLAADDATKVISFYAEDIIDARHIIETGRAILSRADAKPVIALKSGKTQAGSTASSSHTGALAGNDAAYDALFKQAGIVRVDGLEDLTALLEVASKNRIPETTQVAIVTNAGGLGVMATDACVHAGLSLAPLSEATVHALQGFLPAAANSHNPVDVLGDARADRYERALDVVLSDASVGMLIVIITPQAMTEAEKTAQAIVDARDRFPHIPVVVSLSGDAALAPATAYLAEHRVATLHSPEAAARTLGQLSQVMRWRQNIAATPFDFSDIDQETAQTIMRQIREQRHASEVECLQLLSCYGFRSLASTVVTSREEALTQAQSIGKPVALKIVSPDITHKSDAGGVVLNVMPDTADQAYDALMTSVTAHVPTARLEGAIVVEMAAPGGRELILGLKKEPGLGTLIMLGLGGIFVEVFKDVSFRFAESFMREDAEAMLRELKSYPLLSGTRGQAGIDKEALIDALGRLARIATDFPEIVELDINPLLTFEQGSDFRVLDARIRIEKV